MSKKLAGNGLWESSRMMLPEHKSTIIKNDQLAKKRRRIELDEQEWEDISRAVTESLELRKMIKLRMYHEYEDLEIIGVVDRVDQFKKRFMVNGDWYFIVDIEGAVIEGN